MVIKTPVKQYDACIVKSPSSINFSIYLAHISLYSSKDVPVYSSIDAPVYSSIDVPVYMSRCHKGV